jgi:hypothetical protein
MGVVLLRQKNSERRVPLSSSFRVGRHWSCDICLADRSLPLYWVELRWREKEWVWRVLAAEARTKPQLPNQNKAWSLLSEDKGSVRIECLGGDFVELVLLSAAPPELIIEDLQSGERHVGETLEGLVERHPNGKVWALGQEPPIHLPLQDGEVFSLHKNIYRAHVPSEIGSTVDLVFDVSAPDVFLSINIANLSATFSLDNSERILHGEPVRTLIVYAKARREEDELAGGWLTIEDAYEGWLQLGGRRESKPERIAWERGKLRAMLAAQGVLGVETLFEVRKTRSLWENRLHIHPKNILLY